MKTLGTLLVVLSIGFGVSAVQVHGQEPRLPAPTATPSESEALLQRARALSAAGNHRESAATWQTVAAREPSIASLASRESIRSRSEERRVGEAGRQAGAGERGVRSA